MRQRGQYLLTLLGLGLTNTTVQPTVCNPLYTLSTEPLKMNEHQIKVLQVLIEKVCAITDLNDRGTLHVHVLYCTLSTAIHGNTIIHVAQSFLICVNALLHPPP